MSDNSDSEYESEDDEDYIPEEPSSEEEVDGGDRVGKKTAKRNKKTGRKGGIKLDESGEVSPVTSEIEYEDEQLLTADENAKGFDDEASKQKLDHLWATFKQDTANIPSATHIKQDTKGGAGDKVWPATPSSSSTAVVPKKVKVTEIFDFAGEEVKVEKSVDASSIEPSTNIDKEKEKMKATKYFIPTKRPAGGLGSILGKIGKKPKMSTLEKSKLDWNAFKQNEGIEDDLKRSNRDGYLEKQAFLNRVDHKQFAIERDIRQGVRKR